ncbi:MAG: hypothetical protein QOI24_1558 [Acidobacteriota bacterium]|jgi:hypothetical protein|nr:hypothetical protein [Acidobacteriota bacterium]
MPGWLKIILVLFGLFVLVIVGISVAGYYYVREHGGELKQKTQKLQAEGESFGQGKTAAACLDESLAHLKRETGFISQVQTQIFFTSCLSKAEPSPELCEGIPAPDEILASGKWSAEQCGKRGLGQSQGCVQLYNVALQNCRKTSR